MSALPENWEWDYDGRRWFYRYKPTGLVQYNFPRPGDEFPEIDLGAAAPDLAPEERLESQQQVKRRSVAGEGSSKPPTNRRRDGSASASASASTAPAATATLQNNDGGFWFQPDSFMYGTYTDISPLPEQDEEDELALGQGTRGGEGTGIAEALPAKDPSKPDRSHISPLASAVGTPLSGNSQPATVTPVLDHVVTAELDQDAQVNNRVAQPMILSDGRPNLFSPVGFVAELASEQTAQCLDETNPAPVELPTGENMDVPAMPTSYANAFDLAPVELPAHLDPMDPYAVEQKVLGPQVPADQNVQTQPVYQNPGPEQSLQAHQTPPSQAPTPQPALEASQTSEFSRKPVVSSHRPYHLSQSVAGVVNPSSTAESRHPENEPRLKNQVPVEPGMPSSQISDVPSFLQQPQKSATQASSHAENPRQPLGEGPGALYQSVSNQGPPQMPARVDSAGTTHSEAAPSALQPSHGRHSLAQSMSLDQLAQPNKGYQAYRPYRAPVEGRDAPAGGFQQTGLGQGMPTPAGLDAARPRVARTSTLPADLPALPYMGVRPQMPRSAPTAPPAMQNIMPPIVETESQTSSPPPRGETRGAVFHNYSSAIPFQSPDLPQPLNINRKTPVPAATTSHPGATVSRSSTTSPKP
ncbi:hypothetical protein B0T24DRAFT_489058, partial [Lasiosphaeria ovina]